MAQGARLTGGEQAARRELAQAMARLETSYRLLTPRIRDPERLTLRYHRLQQRIAWVLNNYRRLLPEDAVYRLQGRLGQPVLASPFDETIPSRRAVLRLRLAARDLLAAVPVDNGAGAGFLDDPWQTPEPEEAEAE